MSRPDPVPAPVLQSTPYEMVSALLYALVGGLGLATVGVGAIWFSSLPRAKVAAVPLDIIEDPGGEEDGAVDETLQVTSDAPETDNASLAEVESETTEVEESLDSVLEVATEAVNQSERQFELDTQNAGQKGSASGTGRKPLGRGNGKGGFPREQRWYIRYEDRLGLDEYARQLDFFEIELGALVRGELIYLKNLSQGTQSRTSKSGAEEQRLYMTWQGGNRRTADLKLFEKAGHNVQGATLFHFYPQALERKLVQLEVSFANRPPASIRRTYFAVKRVGNGYELYVSRQIPLQ